MCFLVLARSKLVTGTDMRKWHHMLKQAHSVKQLIGFHGQRRRRVAVKGDGTDLQLGLHSAAEQAITCHLLYIHDTLLIQRAHSQQVCLI